MERRSTMRYESLEDRRLLSSNVELVADLGTTPIYSTLDLPQGVSVVEDQTYFFQLIRQQNTPVGVELRQVVGQGSDVVESWFDANVEIRFGNFVHAVGSDIYFTVNVDGADELRRYNANAEASELVFRFDNDQTNITQLARVESGIFFVATTAEFGRELYFTEGTPQSTTVFDLYPGGSEFRGVFEPFSSEPSDLTVLGDQLIFVAKNELGDNGEVWVSDGTADNTTLLRDILPGADGSSPSALTRLGDNVFFTASSEDGSGRNLWQTDGTIAGTQLVSDPDIASNSVEILGEHAGRLYFVDNEEFTSISTSGRRNAISPTLENTNFAFVEGRLFEYDQSQLWGTDQANDTTLIHQEDGSARYGGFHRTTEGRFGFIVGGNELWTTDGTEDGTFQVAGSSGGMSHYDAFAPRDFYLVRFDTGQTAIWSADWDRRSPLESFFNGVPAEWVETDDGFWISGDAGRGPELWFSDGTRTSPTILQPSPLGNNSAAATEWSSDAQEELLFFERRNELWVTDGSQEGTSKIGDLPPRLSAAAPEQLHPVDGGIYFSIQEADSSHSQYFASGSTLRKIGDVDAANQIALVENSLLVDTGITERRLLSIDLVSLEVEELNAGILNVDEISVVGDDAFFVSQRGNEWSIWATDGTAAGTRFLDDASTQIDAHNFVEVDGQIVFVRGEPTFNRETLWTTDGTALGTRPLVDIPQGRAIQRFEQVGERLLAFALPETELNQTEIWEYRLAENRFELSTTVEARGTILLNQNRSHVAIVGFHINGNSIWVSDGTEVGTSQVATPDVAMGQLESGKEDFYFTASIRNNETGVREFSVWQIDAPAGTVQSIVASTPELVLTPRATAIRDNLIFLAWDKLSASEFRKISLDAPIAGDANADGQVNFADFLLLSQNFGKAEDAIFSEGDFDGDGDIDFADFLLLAQNFGG